MHFYPGESTINPLEEFSNVVRRNLNKNSYVVALFIDLSKAFDMINRKLLLQKLHLFGIRGKLCEWLRNYLSDRNIIVKIDKNESRKFHSYLRVPQGSILGPLLFLSYINDITELIKHCIIFIYADDIALHSAHVNFLEAVKYLNINLESIQKWCHDAHLIKNEKKLVACI